MHRALIILFSFLLLIVLSACSSNPKSTEVPSKQLAANILPDNWLITGRISLSKEQENWYAKFIWIQKNQDFQLSFTGPLGETALQISQRGQQVSIKTPSGERSGHNLEQMIAQETGLNLPISSLRYWLQANPNPNTPAKITYTEQQQISTIEQAQWRIQYPKRMLVELASGGNLLLPKKIVAKKQDTKIKLIITRWQLGEAVSGENTNAQ
ncbi:lipoprotein insertase outer membrane protein LolB [sulfur-oxidizing endosymbiont of Gigantopelta aegis]|uniref:lipoprotein insertase outer membrane protein LolB n=1 Tax=sulfur-oxidizing endosymbiont of Gigantopelta aegis TaxID=2794934 RepID=UPI0018DB0B45|nr:lipoprotein insertase outer membrane protein LolB [sulfur-oxidizing endosymbiont of Gigantopelta aegis]